MGALIDASVLIAAERGALNLTEKLRALDDGPIAISAITASALLHGVYRATVPAIRTRRSAFVERLLAEIPVVPLDLAAARVHARLWAALAAAGTTVGAHDLLVGATAVALGFSVATRDARSFPRIPGLAILRL